MIAREKKVNRLVGTDRPEGWPEYLGVVACIQYIRHIRGEGCSVRKLFELVSVPNGLPAYYDDLKKNRKGEPSLRFKRDEVRAFFERSLRPVRPAEMKVS